MNKFILRYIGLLTLSFFLIFSSACTNGNKKEKTNAKEEQTIELTISVPLVYKMLLKKLKNNISRKNLT
ncbi:hypothetical protein ACUC2M_01600 [Bacillus cytotoxicus]